jgi:leucine dehydrogenase
MVDRLAQAKATLVVTDLNYDRIKNVQDRYPDVTMVRPDDAYQVRCDVVVPCAPCNDVTLERVELLKCRAIAGAAAFVVPTLEVADRLHQRSILFMPHFVIDAGGAIQADFERKGMTGSQLRAAVEGVYRRARSLYEAAREAGESPFRTALRLAQSRLTAIGDIGRRNAL